MSDKNTTQSGRRRTVRVTLGLLALLLALILGVWLDLTLKSTRLRLLAAVSDRLEEASGLRLQAEDWRVRPLRGRFVVERPRLVVAAETGSERTLFEAENLEVRFSLVALLGKRIGSVRVSQPLLDLAALPEAPPDEDPEPAAVPEWQIGRLRVDGGRVIGLDVSAASNLLDAAAIEGLALTGSLQGGRFTGRLDQAFLETSGGRLDGKRFAISSGLELDLAGPLRIDGLTVTGEGLSLGADLVIGLEPNQPMTARFEIESETGRLLEESAGGRLEVSGQLDLRRRSGRLQARADDLPGPLLTPFLAPEAAERMDLAATRATLEIDLEAEPDGIVGGEGRLRWQRHGQNLVEARIEVFDGRFVGGEDLDLTSLGGRLRLEAAAAPAELLLPWIVEPDLRRELEGTDLEGTFDLVAAPAAQPAPATLSVDGELALRRGPDRLLRLLIEGGRLPFREDGVDIADIAGSVRLTAALPGEVLVALARPALGDAAGPSLETLRQTSTSLDLALLTTPDGPPLDAELHLRLAEGDRSLLEADAVALRAARGADGRIDLSSIVVRTQLRLAPISLDRLRPFLPETVAGQLGEDVWRSSIEAQGSFVAGVESSMPDASVLSVSWSGEGGRLANLELGTVTGSPVAIRAALSLLPDLDGERRLGATLRASSWKDLLDPARLEIDEGELEARTDDLDRLLTQIESSWPGELPSYLDRSGMAADLLRGGLDAEIRASGPATAPDLALELAWRPHGGALARLEGSGRMRVDTDDLPASDVEGSLELQVEGLELVELGLGPGTGRLSASARLEGERGDFTSQLTATLFDLQLGEEGPRLDELHLDASSEGETLYLRRLLARNRTAAVQASGRMPLEWPPRDVSLHFEAEDPSVGVQSATFDLTLQDGRLRIESGRLLTDGGEAELLAEAPLESIARLPGAQAIGEIFGVEPGTGTIEVVARFPELDSQTLYPFLGLQQRPERLVAKELDLELDLDPENVRRWRGSLSIGSLYLETAEHVLDVPEPIRARLDGGELTLSPLTAQFDDQPLELAASVRLRDQISADVIEHLRLDANGRLDLKALNPILFGGAGSGPLELQAEIAGPLDDLEGRVLLDGRGGRIDYITPYVSRFEDPRVELTLAQGEVEITEATATLNDGRLVADGVYSPEVGTFLDTSFSDVRYYLDYGLSAVLSGDLSLQFEPEEEGYITGEVVVERGLVRRSVDLERELLQRLFAPRTLDGGTADETTDIALDLRVVTRNGVRVRNNVADLRATWSPLLVRGTLGAPLIDGVVDVDPGGLLFAYGQTLRLDRATLTFYGQPGAEPSLDLVTTSSLEDPEIARGEGPSLDPFSYQPVAPAGSSPSPTTALGWGLADYFGERVASTAGELLSAPLQETGITVRPLLAFTESDPDARLTIGRDLTDYLALAVSINLRQAERRTYLLDLQRIPRLPRFHAQVFTNELDNQGATLQQTLSFGGGPAGEAPIVRRFEIELASDDGATDRPDVGGLRRAVSLETRQPLPDGALFDTEIELTEALRRRGFSDPLVQVRSEALGGNRVAVVARIEPGPKTEVRFEGTLPPSKARSAIAALYRSDFYEAASLEEMRRQTELALRSEGYLEPQVEVEGGEVSGGRRTVTIRAEGGRRTDIGTPEFRGIGEELATLLEERFATRLARTELAAGEPQADAAVVQTLAAQGFAQAEVAGRELGDDGRELMVAIEPGPRRQVSAVEIRGAPQELVQELRERNEIAVGDPVVSARLATAAIEIESYLRRRGYVDARVVTRLEPTGPEEVEVRFVVEPGVQYRLAGVTVEGTRTTRQRWAENLAELEPGEVPTPSQMANVRRRYYETGLFSSVYVDTRQRPEEQALDLLIGVDERDRFTFAYGLRWESDEGAGIVLDFLDRNLLGRGISLGARGLYTDRNQIGRLYSTVPRIFGSRYRLETLAEVRNEEEDLASEGLEDTTLSTDTLDASLQLARSFGRSVTGRVYGRYREQRFLTVVDDPFFPIEIEERLTTPFLGLQYIYSRETGSLSARRGLFASADVSGSGKWLGSDLSYVRFFGQVNLHRPIGRIAGRLVGWSQSYRVGLADSFNDSLQRDLRFFAGGEYSVRGYPRESLGPVERLGPVSRPTGGEALVLLNQELHVPVWGPIGGVAFLDAGNVWETVDDVEADLSTALGLGLRYSSPIGLLRLDVGFPLDRREDDPGVKVYFGFGQVF